MQASSWYGIEIDQESQISKNKFKIPKKDFKIR